MAEIAKSGSETRQHPCPICGYEMCEQFDEKPGPRGITLAVPNGKYICYRHPAAGEPDCKCNCNPHCSCECHAHVVLLKALQTIADFAVGNGDVCEIIARRARAAIKQSEHGNKLPSEVEDEKRGSPK